MAQYMSLNVGGRMLLDERFLRGESVPDLSEHLEPIITDRELDVPLLQRLLEVAHSRYERACEVHQERRARAMPDAWLAPRLHALLRIPRSVAADHGMWAWLAVTHAADYVRWRFPVTEEGKSLKRYFGGDRDQALSRLWWTAELTRNGGDYAPAVRAFRLQDIPSTWVSLDAMHHRPAAQAAIRLLVGDEATVSSDDSNRLASVFNHHLTTVMLDAVAPSPPPDAEGQLVWSARPCREDELFEDDLPSGPDEDPVDDLAVEQVLRLIQAVAAQEGIELTSVADAW
jgi:hypothetical protein